MTRADQYLSKVPEVTLGFWIIKIAATTLGETGGDSVTDDYDNGGRDLVVLGIAWGMAGGIADTSP